MKRLLAYFRDLWDAVLYESGPDAWDIPDKEWEEWQKELREIEKYNRINEARRILDNKNSETLDEPDLDKHLGDL